MKKWLCSPLKIHLVAKNSKCCVSAIGKYISKIFFYNHNFSVFITCVWNSKIHDKWLMDCPKWVSQHYDRGLTKFHAGSKQTLVFVVINNSLPNRQKQQHSLTCIWEILNASLRVSKLLFKILLAESYMLHMSRVTRWPVFYC